MTFAAFGVSAPAYILHGSVDDEFCLPDSNLVSIDVVLLEHLRAQGYKTIAFHRPYGGMQFHYQSDESTRKEGTPRPASNRKKTLMSGPLGQARLQGGQASKERKVQNVQESKTDSSVEKDISDLNLAAELDGLFFRSVGPNALVFRDTEFLFDDVDQRTLRNLRALIRESTARGSKFGVIIFVSREYDASVFRSDVGDRSHFFRPFQHLFFSGDTPLPNVIQIGAPSSDELLFFQRRLRLIDGVETNFRSLPLRLDRYAAELKSEKLVQKSTLRAHASALRELPWDESEESGGALTKLWSMPGRSEVARTLETTITFAQEEQARFGVKSPTRSRDVLERLMAPVSDGPTARVDLNFALLGQPGTGKTTIARLFAQAFKEAGILSSGHFIPAEKADFVGSHEGATEANCQQIFRRALGGVLFVDEVQNFQHRQDGTGYDAIAVKSFLPYLEDRRGEVSVMFATYESEFDRFLSFDDGLKSRIRQRIVLEDYDGNTLTEIFLKMAGERGLTVDSTFQSLLPNFFDSWRFDRTGEFANARSVRSTLDDMQLARVRKNSTCPLSADELNTNFHKYLVPTGRSADGDAALDKLMQQLDELIGLENIKASIRARVTQVKAARLRGEDVVNAPGHFAFVGAPGSGKTTVAELMGEFFRGAGILKSGHVEPAIRGDFLGSLVGETEAKVADKVNAALDGVLFIDEAHRLIAGPHDEHGRTIVGELTKLMDEYRERLCLVIAGYPREIDALFAEDPGWRSRIQNYLVFENYSADETAEIMRLFAREANRTIEPALDNRLREVASALIAYEGNEFANGRSARNLIDVMKNSLDSRFVADPQTTDPRQITLDDVPKHLI